MQDKLQFELLNTLNQKDVIRSGSGADDLGSSMPFGTPQNMRIPKTSRECVPLLFEGTFVGLDFGRINGQSSTKLEDLQLPDQR